MATTFDLLTAAVLILLGTGGLMASRDLGCLPAAMIGLVMAIAAVLERRRIWPKVMRGVTAAVALIGMVGTASYLPAVVRLIGGQDLPHQMRIVVLALTGVLCFVYVTVAVRAFLADRRAAS